MTHKASAPTKRRTAAVRIVQAVAFVCFSFVAIMFAVSLSQVRQERNDRESEQTAWRDVLAVSTVESRTQRIFANDHAVPAAPYYAAMIAGDKQNGVEAGYKFPMRSVALQPGVLAEVVQVLSPRWLTQPIAIVGDDHVSMEWLKLHLERLQSLKTTVIVVTAESEKSFKTVQQLVEGLPIVPDSGQWLQARLKQAGVTVYPIYIGLNGKAQQLIFDAGFERGKEGSGL